MRFIVGKNTKSGKVTQVNVDYIASFIESTDSLGYWPRVLFKDVNNDEYEWPGSTDMFLKVVNGE